jgi:hypothetical protein
MVQPDAAVTDIRTSMRKKSKEKSKPVILQSMETTPSLLTFPAVI